MSHFLPFSLHFFHVAQAPRKVLRAVKCHKRGVCAKRGKYHELLKTKVRIDVFTAHKNILIICTILELKILADICHFWTAILQIVFPAVFFRLFLYVPFYRSYIERCTVAEAPDWRGHRRIVCECFVQFFTLQTRIPVPSFHYLEKCFII